MITRSVHYKQKNKKPTQNYFITFTENSFRGKGPSHDLTTQTEPQRLRLGTEKG